VVKIDMSKIFRLIAGLLIFAFYSQTAMTESNARPFEGINPEFELINHNGEVVTQELIRGHSVLLAFGFTQCLHICPMMAANMALALKAAGQNAMGIFISVDTERDTPTVAQAYASSFHPSMMGLGGDYRQIRQAANNFKVSFVVTKSQKAYTVEHTSDIFLIGPDGSLIDVFALNASPKVMADAMRAVSE
jgi:protein SCO1/2